MDGIFFHSELLNSSRVLYTPSLFAKNNLMHLQEVGQLQAQKQYKNQRDGLRSYLFFMVVSGSGTLEYESELYQLEAGDCVFIDCRNSYAHQTSNNLWHLKWIHFCGSNLDSIYEKYVQRGGLPVFRPSDLYSFDRIWETVYALASSSDHIRDMRIFESLVSLSVLLMDESWHPDTARESASKRQNLQEVKDYLDENFQQQISLDDLSARFFINKFYLTRVFKAQFGISINTYILQQRITHAKQMLRFTDKTVSDIGIACGMESPNYFSRMFKKIEGISPSEYRKKWY